VPDNALVDEMKLGVRARANDATRIEDLIARSAYDCERVMHGVAPNNKGGRKHHAHECGLSKEHEPISLDKFLFRVVEFVPGARSGTSRVDNAAAKRPVAVSQRTEGSPHTAALCPATSTPTMKAAEPMPRTQPYSKAPELLRGVVELDQESARASASGTSGASMAAWVRFTKASSQKWCAGK
jgi:hypothetical protein